MSELYSRYVQLCEENGKVDAISFELTNFCNFSCKHCYRVHGNIFLEQEYFHKTLLEAEALGAIMINFNGGEPTLHPHFFDFARHVLEHGMHLSVLTNGSGLTDPLLDALSPWCKGVYFQFSLYGISPQTCFDITGEPDAFEKTISRILAVHRHGFDLRVTLLALGETADGLPALISRLRDEGINIGLIVQLNSLENGQRPAPMLYATDDQILRLLPFSGNWETDHLEPTATWNGDPRRTIACSAGITSFGIRADGRIVPCQVFTSPDLGHVSTDSLASVLAGEARRRFLEANMIPDTCRNCDLWNFCMRCPADACFETGSLTGIPAESCRIARLRAKFHIDSRK